MNVDINYIQIKKLIIEYYKIVINNTKNLKMISEPSFRLEEVNEKTKNRILPPTRNIIIDIPVYINDTTEAIVSDVLSVSDIKKIIVKVLELKKEKAFRKIAIDKEFTKLHDFEKKVTLIYKDITTDKVKKLTK